MKLEEMIGEKVMQPITIPCGQILGTKAKVPGVIAYKGIRYATAGRFEYPVEVTSWEGVYEATEYGNCCYQPRSFYDEEKVPDPSKVGNVQSPYFLRMHNTSSMHPK